MMIPNETDVLDTSLDHTMGAKAMADEPRRNLEAESLAIFNQTVTELGETFVRRGYTLGNRFDPGFGLLGTQGFQFGDLRIEKTDRVVVIEVEVPGHN